MTRPDPLPSSGGSYTRDPRTGALSLAGATLSPGDQPGALAPDPAPVELAEPAPAAPAKPAVKGGVNPAPKPPKGD